MREKTIQLYGSAQLYLLKATEIVAVISQSCKENHTYITTINKYAHTLLHSSTSVCGIKRAFNFYSLSEAYFYGELVSTHKLI